MFINRLLWPKTRNITLIPTAFRSTEMFKSVGIFVPKEMLTLSDLNKSSNLIGSRSPAIAALFTRYRMDNALFHKTKNKMAGVNSRFASISESEILRIKENA